MTVTRHSTSNQEAGQSWSDGQALLASIFLKPMRGRGLNGSKQQKSLGIFDKKPAL